MSYRLRDGSSRHGGPDVLTGGGRTPGKRTLTELVQRRKVGSTAQSPDSMREIAAQGVRGGGSTLPHIDRIQASFGAAHDLSGIRAHVGGEAGAAAESIGAEAYATGQDVAFRTTPDLHTAAHEAAHVVQQRQGVQLYGGVGEEGDAYERQADAVADRVVAGQPAADLLGAPGAHASGAVQRREKKDLTESTAEERDAVAERAQFGSGDAINAICYLAAKRLDLARKEADEQFAQEEDDAVGRQDIVSMTADTLVIAYEKALADLAVIEKTLQYGHGVLAGPLGLDELHKAILRTEEMVLAVSYPDVSAKYEEVRAAAKKLRKLAHLDPAADRDFDEPKHAKTKEDKLLKSAIKQNLDAAKHNATMVRIDLKSGGKKDLGDWCRAVHYHLSAADTLISEAKKPKTYKKDVKKATAEVAAMHDDIRAKRADLYDQEAIFVSVQWMTSQIRKRVGLRS